MNTNFKQEICRLKDIGVLPVVCLTSEDELNTFLDAVLSSPLNCVEITLRHPFAIEAIKYIKKNHPSLIVGAGTVLSQEALEAAVCAGADFCVSPGLDENLLLQSLKQNMFFIPGCCTPTEIIKASNLGCKLIKFFPAEGFGGIRTLKLYQGALSGISFIPTGGITLENLPDYLNCKNVIACGGSYMMPKDLLKEGKSREIKEIISRCCFVRRQKG